MPARRLACGSGAFEGYVTVAAHYVDLLGRPDDGPALGANILDAAILDTKYASSSLHQAIACLPADQRELILDVYFRDIKLVEIARRDGVSRSAISHRLATAEKNLKNFLI